MKNTLLSIIFILIILLIYSFVQIIKLENHHYAVQVGFCLEVESAKRNKCLNNVKTRSNPIWHLLYGLEIL